MSDWISTFPGYSQVVRLVKKGFGRVLQTGPIPQHVGIIMDGNRRYAKSHKMELKEGHNLGYDSMARILETLYDSGIKCVTVYAFSIENFKRLKYEVEWLMDLVKLKFQQLCQHGDLCEKYGIRIEVIGNSHLLPPDIQKILHDTMELTKNNNNVVLNVCFPYTSRDEMTSLIKRIVSESTATGKTLNIDEECVTDNLYTGNSPPLDLLVRTSGTYRLSDFLLWQCVSPKCEIVFTNKLWPEFQPWDMYKILVEWSFNRYWYGARQSPEALNATTKMEAYENDDDDDISTEDSENGKYEVETITSEEEVENK